MSRKTSGALQIQLQSVVKAMEEAVSRLIEKVDTLGNKIDKMPNLASKMADSYVASFGSIVRSVKGLSSEIDKLEGISTGLTKISASLKGFKATEAQAAAFDRLSNSLSSLGPALKKFPTDTTGLDSFAKTVDTLSASFTRLVVPTPAKIRGMNDAANAIRNVANALKSTTGIPPGAFGMLAGMGVGTGGGGGGGGATPPSLFVGPPLPSPPPPPAAPRVPPVLRPPPPPRIPPVLRDEELEKRTKEELERKSTVTGVIGKIIAAAATQGLAETFRRSNVNKELSQVMPLEGGTIGRVLPGSQGTYGSESDYTIQIKQHLDAMSTKYHVNYEDAASALGLAARYTAFGNREAGDVRTMDPQVRNRFMGDRIANAQLINQMTGLDMSSAGNMQNYLGRDLGIKSDEYSKVKDAFIAIQRTSSMTAKDLERLSSSARDSGMALGLSGERAATFVTDMMTGTAALSNAGIRKSDFGDTKAGFFGDKKSLIFDMMAGITDEDYAAGEDVVLQKQYAAMNRMTSGMPKGMLGNYVRNELIGKVAPASIGNVEQFLKVSGQLPEAERQRRELAKEVASQQKFTPYLTEAEQLAQAANTANAMRGGFLSKIFHPLVGNLVGAPAPNQPGGEAPGQTPRSWLGMSMVPGAGLGYLAKQAYDYTDVAGKTGLQGAIGHFQGLGYRVTSGHRDDNPKSDHYRDRALDIGMRDVPEKDLESYKAKLTAQAKEMGLNVNFEGKGQYNEGTGSTSTGRHAHLYGDMSKFTAPLSPGDLAQNFWANAYRPEEKATEKSTEETSLLSRLLKQLEIGGAAGTMSSAVGLFAQAVEILVANTKASRRNSGSASEVASGNYPTGGN